jgi:hypothetical protein
MPQANITYDTRYNRDLVSRLKQLDDKWLNHNQYQYHPSPMGYRMSAFHGERSVEPSIERLYGGVAPSKYILNGNSPAYPLINMRSGMEVSSGGRLAGVDGAVGGAWYDSLLDVGKQIAVPLATSAAKSYFGLGRGKKRGGVQSGGAALMGGAWYDTLASVATHALPLLLGLGRKATAADKRSAVEQGLMKGGFSVGDLGMSLKAAAKKLAPHAMKIMMEEGKKLYGKGFNFGKFLSNAASGVGKAVLPVVQQAATDYAVGKVKSALGSGRKKKGGATSGGLSLSDVLESAKSFGSEVVKKGKDFAKRKASEGVRTLADKGVAYLQKKISGAGRGRSARADIVKKVMKERGCKMIEASKIVKAEGLY